MASSAVSGEGLMCFFQGPGRLWLQTHKPRLEAGAKVGGGPNQACARVVQALLLYLTGYLFLLFFVVGIIAWVAFSNTELATVLTTLMSESGGQEVTIDGGGPPRHRAQISHGQGEL